MNRPLNAIMNYPNKISKLDIEKERHDNEAFVMSQYLQTMDYFLEVQSEVMNAYLRKAKRTPDIDFPFLGSIKYFVANQELVALRKIDLDEDILFRDHAFGWKISVDDTLIPLPVVPLAVSIEIMAEASALLLPDKLLIGVKSIHAGQWIKIEGKSTTIRIDARMQSDNEAKVQIRNLGENTEVDSSKIPVVIEGIMIFGDAYPDSTVNEFAINDAVPCKKTAEQLYNEHLMFHGPCFQGVSSLDRISRNGISATIKTLRQDCFFRSDKNPNLITDFVSLDSVLQICGYWAFEQFDKGYIVFPVGFDDLHIYQPNIPSGKQVECKILIRNVTYNYIQMDAYLFVDGNLWMEILGCKSWRFYAPDEFVSFWRFPDKEILSKCYSDWIFKVRDMIENGMFSNPLLSPFAKGENLAFLNENQSQPLLECYILDMPLNKADQFWIQTFTYQILNHQERQVYQSLNLPESRKHEWLLGRMVAKDAVRMFMNRYGMSIYPADIEIAKDDYGRPMACGYWVENAKCVPKLSLSHSEGIAVAIAGESQLLGVDIEKISDHGQSFGNLAFTKDEQYILDKFPNRKIELQTRFWCAKEAVAKALGHGIKSPLDLIVSDYKETPQESGSKTGITKIVLCERLALEFPEYASNEIVVYTDQYKDYIIAVIF